MATLQFKRVFNYAGSMNDALHNIKTKLNPALTDGEPLICSYMEDGSKKFFLAIGAGEGRVAVHPTFDNQSDFIESIRKYAGTNLIEMFSEDSDFMITLDPETNKYIFKIKDNIVNINWIQL